MSKWCGQSRNRVRSERLFDMYESLHSTLTVDRVAADTYQLLHFKQPF